MPSKTERLEVRLSPEHKRLIESAAVASGQPLSSFAVSQLIERAEEILARHHQTVLAGRDQKLFLEIIDSNDKPTAALRRAAKRAVRATRRP